MDHNVPFGVTPQVYVYEHPQGADDGVLECQAIVVMKRDHGFMVALPAGALTEAELVEGAEAGMEAPLGPSLQVQVSAAVLTDEGPVPQPGVSLACLLVDFSAQAASRFTPMDPTTDAEILLSFDSASPECVPEPSGLLQQALVWAQRPDLVPERVAYYSAEEELPAPRRPVLRLSRSDAPKGIAAGSMLAAAQPPKPKRTTTATLATQLETITAALPNLTAKLAEVASKQESMEARIAAGPAAALREPLGVLGSTPKAVPPAPFTKVGPPPSGSRMLLAPQAPLAGLALEAEELQQDVDLPGTDPLAKAVLAQSQALTALVSQLAAASSDPVLDLGGQGVSTRGAAQRAKLQEELASGRGLFFSAVLANMARRMSPAATASTDPAVLHSQGVCLSRYWERFGGFGSAKDLALIGHQVAMAMDALQVGKVQQAQDHVALLAVCVEQGCMDGGRLDLGYHLTWLEEPPSGMYQARQGSSLLKSRPFTPLASQRWVTVVLGYLKEMEIIQSKRQDTTRPKGSTLAHDAAGDQDAPPKPKRPPRKPKQQAA